MKKEEKKVKEDKNIDKSKKTVRPKTATNVVKPTAQAKEITNKLGKALKNKIETSGPVKLTNLNLKKDPKIAEKEKEKTKAQNTSPLKKERP